MSAHATNGRIGALEFTPEEFRIERSDGRHE